MAGRGSRFEEQGYTDKKPFIDVNGKPMIQRVIENLNIEFDKNFKCIIICQESDYEEYDFSLFNEIIGHDNIEIIKLNGITEGAACTLLTAKEFINNRIPLLSFNSDQMLEMSKEHNKTIWEMKQANELENIPEKILNQELDKIWNAMKTCVERGLTTEGILPGGLNTKRRAKQLHESLQNDKENAGSSDWLCAYAMAVNEENAAGHMVVTAPTNGAAGVVPATLYYYYKHKAATPEQIRQFLLSASAIGGLIKHNSSISGAEVGCQGEVGSASSMAAAGLCAARGGTSEQIENAAEMALEHHIGMTCDPVKGLVQVPCIERNGFGAVKAYTASSLSLRESGEHLISLDQCIAAMKRTGLDMSNKYKETSLGGLAVSFIEC